MTVVDPKETGELRQTVLLALAVLVAGCASHSSSSDSAVDPVGTAEPNAVSKEVYDFTSVADWDRNFRRVDLPDEYDLPTGDPSACFAYVLARQTDDRNLTMSAMMQCVEEDEDK